MDLGRFLSLAYLQQSHASLVALYERQPFTVAAIYFALYVLTTALSVPGATILKLAGGAIFGLGWGLLLVSFASSLGAALAFRVARFVLRDSIAARFGQRLKVINHGLKKDGVFYPFTLRLVLIVPFFVINLAMGLTNMRVGVFYLVSQLGMLARKLVDSIKKRQVYARWAAVRPKTFDRNLVVIGAGAGGLVSAYIAAAVKARVTLVEAHKMGDDCLNYGCIPSKALIKSARLAHQMQHAERYGLDSCLPISDKGQRPISLDKSASTG